MCSKNIDEPQIHYPLLQSHHISYTLSRKLKRLHDPPDNRHTTRGSQDVALEWVRNNQSDAYYCCTAIAINTSYTLRCLHILDCAALFFKFPTFFSTRTQWDSSE
jgi:hypothetical protein